MSLGESLQNALHHGLAQIIAFKFASERGRHVLVAAHSDQWATYATNPECCQLSLYSIADVVHELGDTAICRQVVQRIITNAKQTEEAATLVILALDTRTTPREYAVCRLHLPPDALRDVILGGDSILA